MRRHGIIGGLVALMATVAPAMAELPRNVTVVLDSGERIDVEVGDPARQWPGVPARGVYRIEFNNDQLRCTGADFWVYAEEPNVLVFGCRKPAQDEDTPNFVPETFTEIVWDRRPEIRPLVRYPTSIPLAALPSLKRWRY